MWLVRSPARARYQTRGDGSHEGGEKKKTRELNKNVKRDSPRLSPAYVKMRSVCVVVRENVRVTSRTFT